MKKTMKDGTSVAASSSGRSNVSGGGYAGASGGAGGILNPTAQKVSAVESATLMSNIIVKIEVEKRNLSMTISLSCLV